MKNLERQSNIELLRILSILGVIVLHYNNKTIGGGFQFVTGNSLNYYFLMILESICICAVDLFMLISGYFSCLSKKTVLNKPFKLIVQVIFFSFSWNFITGILNRSVSIKALLYSLIPANYFVILYITVYLLSPYLNIVYEKMSSCFIFLIFLIFSIYPTFVDVFSQITGGNWLGLSTIGMYGSQWGYQIVNFIMMYYIGMYIRKNKLKLDGIKSIYVLLFFCIIAFLITLWSCLSQFLGFDRNLAWSYCNPLVVLEAIVVFILFLKVKIGCIKFINQLSAATFTTFLAHTFFISYINIKWAVQQNIVILICHILISSIAIYFLCYILYLIYDSIFKIVFKKIDKKNIVITQL